MLTHKRIYTELGYSLLICLLLIPQIQGIKPILLFVLGFAVVLLVGCLFELAKQSWAKWLLIIGSSGILCVGVCFSLLRIQFILVNHGMDRAEPPSSPMAFLLGWMFTTMVFLMPGTVLSLWNIQSLLPTKIGETKHENGS